MSSMIMRHIPRVIPAFAEMTVLMLFFALTALAQTPQNNTPQKDFVTAILPYPPDYVHERASALFDSDTRDYYDNYPPAIYDLPGGATNVNDLPPATYKRFMAFPLARATKFYVFFAAYPHMQNALLEVTPLSVIGHNNAALQRYATLPAAARAQDFYLWSPDAPFWYSEYSANGKPVPFRSYFIVHMIPADAAHTNVEIIEDQPVVQMGKKLSVDANGAIHHFDIREVQPTTTDREFLLSCIRQFIDRKVPGRHYFSCKTPAQLAEPAPVPFTVP